MQTAKFEYLMKIKHVCDPSLISFDELYDINKRAPGTLLNAHDNHFHLNKTQFQHQAAKSLCRRTKTQKLAMMIIILHANNISNTAYHINCDSTDSNRIFLRPNFAEPAAEEEQKYIFLQTATYINDVLHFTVLSRYIKIMYIYR